MLRPHLDPLRRYFARRCPPDAVDDLLQSLCETAWRRRDAIPEGAELLWLYGVARNLVMESNRRRARRAAILSRHLPFLAQPSTAPALLAEGADEEFLRAFAALDEDDRELLRLWAWEQLGYREIAALLGVSESAASSRLTRARQRLGGHLGVERTPDENSQMG